MNSSSSGAKKRGYPAHFSEAASRTLAKAALLPGVEPIQTLGVVLDEERNIQAAKSSKEKARLSVFSALHAVHHFTWALEDRLPSLDIQKGSPEHNAFLETLAEFKKRSDNLQGPLHFPDASLKEIKKAHADTEELLNDIRAFLKEKKLHSDMQAHEIGLKVYDKTADLAFATMMAAKFHKEGKVLDQREIDKYVGVAVTAYKQRFSQGVSRKKLY